MSSALGDEREVASYLRERLHDGLRRIALFIIPSAVAFVALGDVVIGALYQTGSFRRADTVYVWAILAGSAVGLLASTLGRLFASTFYALHDTRTPLRYAIVRVVLTMALGYLAALELPGMLGIAPRWGAVGLTISAGVAGWVEFVLLRRGMNARIGRSPIGAGYLARLWLAALAAAAMAWGIKLLLPDASHPVVVGIAVLVPFGVLYFAIAALLRVDEASAVVRRASRTAGLGA
jgi:putative peptidoglycan lipid II flippase